MAKLTIGQVSNIIGISTFTIKRWYKFWEDLANTDIAKLNELCQNGMPALPMYETIGNRGDKVWDEDDIEALKEFKNWVPHTRNGIFTSYNKTKNKED